MLQLKNIVKIYEMGDATQTALQDVSVNFRDNEFVSILGQSGSGKTTLLNIIGGLDRYTSGDLIINGVSTKEYTDANWDTYRNHSIGFIFQSYNLIPHQTVLSNVEMALTLSGVSKKERRERAVAVLEKVGLSDHINKRPNQMSGGQMQRVAIARALINNPDILLADEPTGALDSETSIQIMDLLKEIAKDKLVIMVTHNPELAEKYSTRVVNLLDGKIISDTDPYNDCDEPKLEETTDKVSMSFLTALSLSFNNLKTKKARTILTAFAGSIGIIGIALILSLSQGMSSYIDDVQKKTMESYPITISSTAFDALDAFSFDEDEEKREQQHKNEKEKNKNRNAIYADYSSIEAKDMMASTIKTNNLTEFKKYLDDPSSPIQQYIGENGVVYTYDIKFSAYSYNADKKFIDSDIEVDEDDGGGFFSGFSSFFGGDSESTAGNFSEMLKGTEGEIISSIVTDNYDLIYGSWPKKYNEVLLVINRQNTIPAEELYQLGLITKKQYDDAVEKIESGKEADNIIINYDEIAAHTFYLVPACDMYLKNENGTFTKIDDYEKYEKELTENKTKLKIVGIIRPAEEAENRTISTPVAYTHLLTDYIIEHTEKSEIVKAQKKSPDVNILSGTKFDASSDKEKIEEAKSYIKSLDETGKANLYRMILLSGNSEDEDNSSSFSMPNIPSIPDLPSGTMPNSSVPTTKPSGTGNVKPSVPGLPGVPTTNTPSIPTTEAPSVPSTDVTEAPSTTVPSGSAEATTEPTTSVPTTTPEQGIIAGQKEALSQAHATIDLQQNMLSQAQSAIGQQQNALTNAQQVIAGQQSALIQSQAQLQMMAGVMKQIQYAMNEMSSMTEESKLAEKIDEWVDDNPDEEMLLTIYDQYIGEATYDDNMSEFGLVSYDSPASISIYTDSYEDKDLVAACIVDYNSKKGEEEQIVYTDYIALLTSSLTTIINGISYVLIAFVAISLIVSCIMIGIITHISVMERTKEIGILRALGASKGNISQVFNAETFIIGCCSGLLGVIISFLALFPINAVIERVTEIQDLNAQLPILAAIMLIGISVLITILGGLIPSRKAAKKDPVVALRTE